MKVRFWPRDIGMFRNGDFDFSDRGKSCITLQAQTIFDYKDFYDRGEMIEYLKSCGVRLDDPKYPLTIDNSDKSIVDILPYLPNGKNVYKVEQQSLLGWMKEL